MELDGLMVEPVPFWLGEEHCWPAAQRYAFSCTVGPIVSEEMVEVRVPSVVYPYVLRAE